MNEAPKKIWVGCNFDVRTLQVFASSDTKYIRSDLVDGLVEALEMCVKHLDADGNLWSKEEQTMAFAALKALED